MQTGTQQQQPSRLGDPASMNNSDCGTASTANKQRGRRRQKNRKRKLTRLEGIICAADGAGRQRGVQALVNAVLLKPSNVYLRQQASPPKSGTLWNEHYKWYAIQGLKDVVMEHLDHCRRHHTHHRARHQSNDSPARQKQAIKRLASELGDAVKRHFGFRLVGRQWEYKPAAAATEEAVALSPPLSHTATALVEDASKRARLTTEGGGRRSRTSTCSSSSSGGDGAGRSLDRGTAEAAAPEENPWNEMLMLPPLGSDGLRDGGHLVDPDRLAQLTNTGGGAGGGSGDYGDHDSQFYSESHDALRGGGYVAPAAFCSASAGLGFVLEGVRTGSDGQCHVDHHECENSCDGVLHKIAPLDDERSPARPAHKEAFQERLGQGEIVSEEIEARAIGDVGVHGDVWGDHETEQLGGDNALLDGRHESFPSSSVAATDDSVARRFAQTTTLALDLPRNLADDSVLNDFDDAIWEGGPAPATYASGCVNAAVNGTRSEEQFRPEVNPHIDNNNPGKAMHDGCQLRDERAPSARSTQFERCEEQLRHNENCSEEFLGARQVGSVAADDDVKERLNGGHEASLDDQHEAAPDCDQIGNEEGASCGIAHAELSEEQLHEDVPRRDVAAATADGDDHANNDDDSVAATVRVWFPRDGAGGYSGTLSAALAGWFYGRSQDDKGRSRLGHASIELVWGSETHRQQLYVSLWPNNFAVKDESVLRRCPATTKLPPTESAGTGSMPITLEWDIRQETTSESADGSGLPDAAVVLHHLSRTAMLKAVRRLQLRIGDIEMPRRQAEEHDKQEDEDAPETPELHYHATCNDAADFRDPNCAGLNCAAAVYTILKAGGLDSLKLRYRDYSRQAGPPRETGFYNDTHCHVSDFAWGIFNGTPLPRRFFTPKGLLLRVASAARAYDDDEAVTREIMKMGHVVKPIDGVR